MTVPCTRSVHWTGVTAKHRTGRLIDDQKLLGRQFARATGSRRRSERERSESKQRRKTLSAREEITGAETHLPFLGRFWMTSTATWKRFWWSTTGSAIAGTGMATLLFWSCWRDDWWCGERSVFSFSQSKIIKSFFFFFFSFFNRCHTRVEVTSQYKQEP